MNDESFTFLDVMLLHSDSKFPVRSTPDAAGFDVHAYMKTEQNRDSKILIPKGNTRLVPTGIVVRPPPDHAILVCSRSGLAAKHSLFVANAPGVVDPDYTGELGILLYNGGFEPYYVLHEQRVAQLLIVPIGNFGVREIKRLPETSRGSRGFGSTGS